MIGAKTASAISNALAEGALSTRFKRDIHQALGLTFTDLDLPEPIRNSNETAELLRMWRDLPTEDRGPIMEMVRRFHASRRDH